MTLTTSASIEEIAAFFRAPLDILRERLAPVADDIAAAGRLSAARLDDLVAPHAFRMMDASGAPLFGAGFIVTPELLTDTADHLAWWQGRGTKTKLVLAEQSIDKQTFDYRERDWYRVPMATGQPHIFGPYVDYLCSDEYTLTITAPVLVGGHPAGVLGVDLLLEDVEHDVAPMLMRMGRVATLVNHDGRVIVSTDPAHAAGDTLRGAQVAGLSSRACSPELPLRLLEA